MNRTTSVHCQGGKRRLLYLTLLLMTGLVVGPAARAAATDVTTLAGETFSGGGLQTLASGVCNEVGPSTFTWSVTGMATGPVAGTFSAMLTITLASPQGPVTAAEGTFEINDGAVTGEISLSAEVNGSCRCSSPDPYPVVSVGTYSAGEEALLLRYAVNAPFVEYGEIPVTELWAAAGNSVFGSPLLFFITDQFVPETSFNWTGFFRPIENTDADGAYILNLVKAGQSVPVKFSLGGDRGLAVFAEGYPQSRPVACDTGADLNSITETVTAGESSLNYDPLSDTYCYIWKTSKAWAGSCRQLDFKLTDGTTHSAQFTFK